MIDKIMKILAEEIIPAEGCTEPIALAYAASQMTSLLGHVPDRMTVFLSGNMIKNVKSVHIPNSQGKVGIGHAVAMGAILGDSSRKLMCISDIDASRLPEVQAYVDADKISIELADNVPKLYIRIHASRGSDTGVLEIQDYHTNITRLEKNNKDVLAEAMLDNPCISEDYSDRSFLSVDLIYDIAQKIDIKLLAPIFEKVIQYNSAIANEGLTNTYGIAIGKAIQQAIADGIYGDDIKNNLASFASAGSDARMNGCPLPVMTTSGSGNQGMTCSLPIIKYCEMKHKSHEETIRALFFSHMTTIHIKSAIGRLSAYCGVMAACGGVSGTLAFLEGMSLDKIKKAIETTLGTVSGVICDGAKSSCATKIATGVAAAVDAFVAAMNGRGLAFGEGIVGIDIERTIEHVGILGQEGMRETDKVILGIMLNNK